MRREKKLENTNQNFKNNSFFKKVLFSIITLIIIIILTYATVTYIGMKKTILDVKNSANMNELAQANSTINYLFEMTKNLALYIYQDEDLVKLLHIEDKEFLNSLDYIKLRTKLNTYTHTFEFSDSIIIYNSKLDLITSTEYSIQNYDKPLANAIKKYINNDMKEYAEFAILDYLEEDGKKNTAFLFGLKDWKFITPDNQTTIGILIKPEWLFDNLEIINKADANQEKEIFILDNKGELYSSDAKLVKDESLNELKNIVMNQPQNSDYFDVYIHNVKYKATYIKNEMCKWKIISIQPYNVFMSQLYKITGIFIAITFTIILIALGLAFIFTKHIYVPVNKVVKQFIHKNKNISNDLKIEDELGFIVKSYENAVSQISIQQSDLKSSKKYIRSYWIKRLLMESKMLSLEELKKNDVEELLNVNLLEEFIIIILNIDENGEFNRHTIENQRIYRYAIENISQEVIGESFHCNIVDMGEENLVVLVSIKDTKEVVAQIEECVRKIQQTVVTYYEFSLSAAISDKIENYSDISKSYKKALHLLSYKLIYGNECMIKESMLEEIFESNKEMFILQKEQKLEGLFISDKEELFRTEINEIFETIKNMKYSEIMSSINYLSFLFYKIIKINFPMQFNEQIKQMNILNKNIFNSASLEEIKEIFIEIYINIHKNPQENISTTNNMLVSTIIQIIEENYKDPNLSQEWIASTLKLSYSNVGKVFKLVEKVSIAEYVNKVRLKYACELLENTNYSINDIFNSVGFINQSYFFTLFKKYFGCTPKQYQLQKKFKQF